MGLDPRVTANVSPGNVMRRANAACGGPPRAIEVREEREAHEVNTIREDRDGTSRSGSGRSRRSRDDFGAGRRGGLELTGDDVF